MQDISHHLQAVLRRMAIASSQVGRDAADIQLLAVSKTMPIAAIVEAYEAGQRHFGENYVQEAVEKINALADLPLTWHLIGPLQSNKTAVVAAHFHWVHSIERLKIAQRLSAQRATDLPPLNLCIQVNIDDEDSKSGCHVSDIEALVKAILPLPRVILRGLMIIPKAGNEVAFQQLTALRQHLLATIPTLDAAVFDTLSMGMSADMEAAIAAGSTMVRVGTAIFGQRKQQILE
ncbi:YggS family pyridoxal phosphate-dependent enzyme [Moraxellaceae bacterium AER2_44_116]|nr:YggS family pyridoxal phosphate-dependent enzyme [Moraxellaceae bacterium]TQC98463.1 YggS family pyridoxal phosphate-dependent enzyme [Moraxellaceae bacterium AER2_44_116]